MSATEVELRKSYLREARDCLTQAYVAPRLVAQAVMRLSKSAITRPVVLDAGCGTGLVGQALATAGGAASSSISSIAAIDGIDFSPAMLAMARKTGVYRNLIRGDLTARILAVEVVEALAAEGQVAVVFRELID
ncbi:uncharacterized protein BO95DRAFT_469476 [Aspergillus brunneoviolaceus CBS 621.78]|uniref:Uncharacterized protein n=1 Tax=Aspergillus brunneoviolaceus CBS 621.78 TaxID=1450534 RepID=A0ACD1FRW2_9EURO|nr:hypothetical protein BO95DRAFT_469476 [Aspergillus brunneoviolaceus CBS 621.78]RAH39706.1 hypothetical protein BO95DRAFT_469476 [Aspergillus brunneoviolaceus CBS 621.78]